MQRTATVSRIPAATAESTPRKLAPQPLAEDQAAQVMWLYYRDHKAQLVSNMGQYRAPILAELMQGVPAERVFAPYIKPPELLKLVKPLRRVA